MPTRWIQRIFPPIVTGPTVLLVGVKLISSGFKNWLGGSGPCMNMPEAGLYSLCPSVNAPHPLPWGATEFIGLLDQMTELNKADNSRVGVLGIHHNYIV